MRNVLFFSLLLLVSVSGYPENNNTGTDTDENDHIEEPEVVKFGNLISVKLSFGYKFMFFQETAPQEYNYETNRPPDIGGGIGFKNFFIGFSFSIPFMYDHNYRESPSFDIDFNFYNKIGLTSGYIKYYYGFHNHFDGNIDLQILTLGITHEYLFNKNHSLRSVYNLDERQTRSNGSILLGAGVFFTAIQSDTLTNYSDNKRTVHFGPNFGYSYTWVFKNNLFLNVLSTFGLDVLIPMGDGKNHIGFQILPRVCFGYHGKTWSANIYFNHSTLVNGIFAKTGYNLISGDIGMSFIKRFL